ncbi:MAG: hypothetical protein S4CHLAM6_05500 [Chlamydiae bacterium]|nr:hypothetical protein [Chlamydiota bacterium]
MLNSISASIKTLQNAPASTGDFATKIKYKSTAISDLKFENQTNETIVGGTSNIYGRLTLNIQPQGQYNRLRQILVGIKDIGANQLIHSEQKIIGKRLEGYMSVDQQNKVYETHSDYAKDFKITAPEKKGLYELEVCIIELEADPVENAGTINGFFKLKDSDKLILESEFAKDKLWQMDDQSCKISMGRIRVI